MKNSTRCISGMTLIVLAVGTAALVWAQPPGGPPGHRGDRPWETNRRHMRDLAGGVPQKILDLQDSAEVLVPSMQDTVDSALAMALHEARPYLEAASRPANKTLIVPDEFETIQAAIDAASPGDVVLVRAGVYHELLLMKDGVRVVSDPGNGGDRLVPVKGTKLELPARALRTILDGSTFPASDKGMVNFAPGVGRDTVLDGFSIRNLPEQNHHIPGHAHAINVRGASPVIINCIIHDNGSTGIGQHVVYKDQGNPIGSRDFRWANIKHHASPVIYNNIIRNNLGLGIGCNHFSSPLVLGNEIFANDDSKLGDAPAPGVGGQHGSFATIIGNIVHNNPGGGILCKNGEPQGRSPIDRPTHPTVAHNVVYDNGRQAPAIAANASGSVKTPVRIHDNVVLGAPMAGITISNETVALIEDNIVSATSMPGIIVNGATALKLSRNKVTGVKQGPGFLFVGGAVITEMIGNAADSTAGPRFMLRDGTIGKAKANP